MAKLALTFLGLAAGSVLTLSAVTASVTYNGAEVDPTRILARFSDGSQIAANAPLLQQAGMKVFRQFDLIPGLVVLEDVDPTAAATRSVADLQANLVSRMQALQLSGQFSYVEADYIVHADASPPTDAAFTNGVLWGLRNYGQSGGKAGADISATNAWNLTTGSTNVIVAVIDTGIRYTHKDLKAQMWKNPGEIPANNKDDDGNGVIDDVYGINAITGSGDPMDDNDHGSHVSGTIGAAANDGNPIVGVTWKVRLMGCKFLSASGSGRTSDAITCINYAVSKGARVLNNSWGGGGYSQSLYDAIAAARAKNVIFLAAAGNSGSNNDQIPHYPSNYNLDNIISIAAVDRSDKMASFSCYGEKTVHIGAPGVSIYSSTSGSDTEYQSFDGTSMATPHVSGVAALILSLYPSADYTEVRQRILLGAVPIPSLTGVTTTGGRLNAYNALTITGSGQLTATIDPPSGSALLTSSSQPIYVKISDTFGVYNATVNGTIAGVTNLTFRNDGKAPDLVANDNTYSSVFTVPASTNTLTLTIVATATNKIGITNLVTYTVVTPPANDYFTNATKVAVVGGTFLANNKFATLETNEPKHNGDQSDAASLWWTWTPTTDTSVLLDLTGSRVETVLAVYTGTAVGSLTAVASTNSTLVQHKPAILSFDAQAGVGYRIAVASASTNGLGTLQLRVAPNGHSDITPPVVFVSSPLSGTSVSDRNLNLTGTAVDPTPDSSGVMEVYVAVNGGAAVSASGTTSWSAPALLTPGLNTIQAQALDEAGNYSSPVTIQVNYIVPTPTNDFFVNALSLTLQPDVTSAVTTNATKEFGEPAHAGNNGGKSVWWYYQPPADGYLTLSTTNSTFDTLLAIYTGTPVSALSCVASNDDAYPRAPVGFSELTQAVRSNQVYHIAVDGFDGVSGTVALHYSFTPGSLFTLTVNSDGNGQVSPVSVEVVSNSTVVLTATPNPFFQFDRWTGELTATTNPLSLVVTSSISLTANFRPIAYSDDFETGDLLKLGWSSVGNLPWTVQSGTVLAGSFAAKSGAIGNNQTSSLSVTTNFGGGALSFYYKVSTEVGWDFLGFYVDGLLQHQWSGEIDWTSYSFPLAAGTHTLEWRYTKDATYSAGLDAAFLDNVNLPIGLPIDGTTPARLELLTQTNGSLLLQVHGQTNREYVIQGAGSLITPIGWQNLFTNTAVDGGFQYVDPGTATNSTRYYRAVTR